MEVHMHRRFLALIILGILITTFGYVRSRAVTLTPINSPPVAVDDSYSPPGRFLPISITAPGVLANDTDADGDPLTVQLVRGTSFGTLSLKPDGSFTFSWSAGWATPDSFTYRISDGKETSNIATVTLNMYANTAPVAVNDFYTVTVGQTLQVYPPGVVANDTDADGDHLLAHIYRYPEHGGINFNLHGGFTYVPYAGFIGVDTFTYRADDGTAARSNESTVTITVTPPPPSSSIQCVAATYSETESDRWVDMTVTRTGDVSGSASVDFVTVDNAGLQDCSQVNGAASPRCDFILATGTLRFGPGETSKLVYISIIDDAYAEGDETFAFMLSNPSGATLGAPGSATITIHDNELSNGVNPVDDTDFFIRQLYLDFLNREPEPKGLADWRNILANCPSGSSACDRIEVASAFFRSPEFQQRGYFIYRFYSVVGKVPLNHEFMPDLAKVSGFLTDQQLEANKVAFVNEFMARPDFQNKYGPTFNDPAAFVSLLLNTVDLPNHPGKQVWVDSLTSGSMTRAQVLRELVDSTQMYQRYYSEAFVVMSYFGYLRRTADSLYLQWVQTLSQSGGTDYRLMVNGFLNSLEYRKRFGP
jgi:Bacterial Ig domain/Calx-beta domain/Domain of unknown function (DUF4214)